MPGQMGLKRAMLHVLHDRNFVVHSVLKEGSKHRIFEASAPHRRQMVWISDLAEPET